MLHRYMVSKTLKSNKKFFVMSSLLYSIPTQFELHQDADTPMNGFDETAHFMLGKSEISVKFQYNCGKMLPQLERM